MEAFIVRASFHILDIKLIVVARLNSSTAHLERIRCQAINTIWQIAANATGIVDIKSYN